MKYGDKFNAYTKIKPHLVRGCPLTFLKASKKSANAEYVIFATCGNLNLEKGQKRQRFCGRLLLANLCGRVFSANDFSFEVLEGNGSDERKQPSPKQRTTSD